MGEKKDKLVAGILEEVSGYLAGDLQDPAAGAALGMNIASLANQFAGEAIDGALQKSSKRLADRVAE